MSVPPRKAKRPAPAPREPDREEEVDTTDAADGLRIGTSGWSYREWRGGFYPPGTPPGAYLAHYARHFNVVELNATAYGLPKPGYLDRWAAAVPVGFRMAIKAPHLITHIRRLRGCEADLREFLTAIRPLGAIRGPLLFQLPPGLAVDAGLLDAFLDLVRPLAEGLPLVCEFRNASWYREDVFATLERAGAACCVHDLPGCGLAAPRTAGLLYLRRHGTAGRYAGSYGRERLQEDARLMAERIADGHEAYAFFNNTMDGSAVSDAALLRSLVPRSAAAG